jgi:hypothetical protein
MNMRQVLLGGLLLAGLVACPTPQQTQSFTFDANPAQVYLLPRGIANINVSVVRQNFDSPISVELADDSTGFSTDPLQLEAGVSNGTLVLRASETIQPGATLAINLKATGGSLVRNATVTSVVAPYTLAFMPSSINVPKGGSSKATVLVGRLTGFTDAVTVTLGDLPSGVTAAPVTIKQGQSSAELTISAASSTAETSSPGLFRINSSAGTQNQEIFGELSVVSGTTTPAELMGSVADVIEELQSLGLSATSNYYSYNPFNLVPLFNPLASKLVLPLLGMQAEGNALLADINFPTNLVVNNPSITTASANGNSGILDLKRLEAFLPSPQTTTAFGLTDAPQIGLSAKATTTTPLPTGIYDCTSGSCPNTGTTSQDLEIRWNTATGTLATMTFDWDGSSDGAASAPATIFLYSFTSNNSTTTQLTQLPTKLRVKLVVGTLTRATANLDIGWQPKPGMPNTFIQFPNTVQAQANVKRADGSTLIDVPNVSLNIVDTTGISASAQMTGTLASVPTNLNLSLNSTGTVTRDTNGNITGYNLTGNANTVNLAAQIADYSIGFETTLSNAQLQNAPRTVDIANGKLRLGKKQMTFAGTLNDANENCVPGEKLNLTFASGSVPLETLLFSFVPIGSNNKLSCLFASAPSTPSNFRIVSQTNTPNNFYISQVNLAWNGVKQAEYISITKYLGANQVFSSYGNCYSFYGNYAQTSCVDNFTQSDAGKTFTYKIRAFSSAGSSPEATLDVTVPPVN